MSPYIKKCIYTYVYGLGPIRIDIQKKNWFKIFGDKCINYD